MSDNQVASTVIQQVEYRFRENKETKTKRDTLTLQVPLPTPEYISTILERDEDDKVKSSVMDAVNGLVVNYLRGIVNENEEFTQETLDELVSKGNLSIDFVGNLPRSQRNTINNAMLAAFGVSFINTAKAVMDDEENRIVKSEKGASMAVGAFVDRLRSAVGKDEVLNRLNQMLDKYCEVASEADIEEHIAVVDWLKNRIEDSLKKEELSLDNLD